MYTHHINEVWLMVLTLIKAMACLIVVVVMAIQDLVLVSSASL